MKKRVVFKKYHYRECDSFADYLERMAAKGWIFKGWKLGLVFYKDQPRKETYAVEIFPDGILLKMNFFFPVSARRF